MTEHSPLPWIAGYWELRAVKGDRHYHWEFMPDMNAVITANQIHCGVRAGEVRKQQGSPEEETQVIGTDGEYSNTTLHLSEADAQHIVRCVNLHDELVKSLDDASWYISQCEDGGSAGAQKLHDHVRALLAKAKGET